MPEAFLVNSDKRFRQEEQHPVGTAKVKWSDFCSLRAYAADMSVGSLFQIEVYQIGCRAFQVQGQSSGPA